MESVDPNNSEGYSMHGTWKGVNSTENPGVHLPPLHFNTSDGISNDTPPFSYQKSHGLRQGVESHQQRYNSNTYQYSQSVTTTQSQSCEQQKSALHCERPGWSGYGQKSSESSFKNGYVTSSNSFNPLASQSANSQTPHIQEKYGSQNTWLQPPFNTEVSNKPSTLPPSIARTVISPGLQAFQQNNNNAAFMNNQCMPMIVPNPHYNGMVHQNYPSIISSDQVHGQTQEYTSGVEGKGYFPTQPPLPAMPGVSHIHQQLGPNLPSLQSYSPNLSSPGKSKTRGKKCFQCPKCIKVFRRGDHLKRHLLSVHDHEHPYQCGDCGKGFAAVPTLVKHAKSLHTGTVAKGLVCIRCQMTYMNTQDLESHAIALHIKDDELYMQNINTSSKQHLCTLCSKSFSSAANLKRHMHLLHKTKEDSKLFCGDCGKAFSRSDNLRKHVDRVHSGNPNAMPDTDEPDTKTVSSGTGSRGTSADTDEGSLSAQSSTGMQWSYPSNRGPITGIAQPPAQFTALGSKTLAESPRPLVGYPDNNCKDQQLRQTSRDLSDTNNVRHDTEAASTAHPLATAEKYQSVQDEEQRKAIRLPRAVEQEAKLHFASIPAAVVHQKQAEAALTVSDALSMAMRTLSEFDYEGISDEYPIAYANDSRTSLFHSSAIQQNCYTLPVVNQNADKHPTSSAHGSSFAFNNSGNSLQSNINFLMTVPPPPVTTNMVQLPLHQRTGIREVHVLQEGGGGPRSPMINNTSNGSLATDQLSHEDMSIMNESIDVQKGRSKKRKRKDRENAGIREEVEDDDEEFGAHSMENGSESSSDFNCTICKTAYKGIDNLMQHVELVHLKKNPHECCICHKKFAQAGNVKRHIRFVHLRERPFRCKDCSSTFDRLCYLQRHMRTHLQPDDNNHDFEHLKPCHCPECGKKCLTAHHLRGHMQRKHFAKNKQNYGQFLMKYKHLEAIGAGPGALTNGSKSRKADKKKRDVQELKKAQFPNGLEFNRNEHRYPSSAVPYSSGFLNGTAQQFPSSNMVCKKDAIDYNHQTILYSNQIHLKRGQCEHVHNNYPQEYFVGQNTLPQNGPGRQDSYDHLQHTNHVNSAVYKDDKSPLPKKLLSRRSNAEGVSIQLLNFRGKRRRGGRRNLRYSCKSCVNKSFLNLPMLKSHISVVHKTSLGRHVCLICGFDTNSADTLQAHAYRMHSTKSGKLRRRKKENKSYSVSFVTRVENTDSKLTLPYQSCLPFYQSTELTRGSKALPSYLQADFRDRPAHNQYGGLYEYTAENARGVTPNVKVGYGNPAHHLSAHPSLVQT